MEHIELNVLKGNVLIMNSLLNLYTNIKDRKSRLLHGFNLWYLLILLVPFSVAFLLLLINGQRFDLKILIPVWNDEVGWHNQVQAVITYGRPLGYYGYNGTHAQFGTFGPWGISPLLPYAVFGTLFGWHLYSMALANLSFLAISLFLFCILTQPDRREMIWMIIMYCISFITIGYSMTSMCEGLRYSLAIVLTGITVYLYRKVEEQENYGKKHLFMILCFFLFTIFAINVYVILALFIPLFCNALLKRKPFHIRIIISLVSTLLIAFIENKIVSLVSSPYTESTIASYVNELKENGLYSMVVYVVDNTFENLETVDLPSVLQANDHTLFWYFIVYLIIMFVSVYNLILTRSERDYIFVYILAGFLFGYCILYTGSGWTLCRGSNTGLICTFLLMSVLKPKGGSFTDLRKLGVLLFVIAIVGIKKYHSGLIYERVEVSAYTEAILQEKEMLTEIMDISEDNDRWNNTVATYGFLGPYWQLALPDGTGTNFMISGEANTEAGYVLINSEEENVNDILNLNIDTGHSVLYRDEVFVILKNDRIVR
ncbi:MAG: hypothetical protein K5770_14180 [Lachnospiraceae bacterium]|nr:hypothetical protein [Lachnospiraceae bacterium]